MLTLKVCHSPCSTWPLLTLREGLSYSQTNRAVYADQTATVGWHRIYQKKKPLSARKWFAFVLENNNNNNQSWINKYILSGPGGSSDLPDVVTNQPQKPRSRNRLLVLFFSFKEFRVLHYFIQSSQFLSSWLVIVLLLVCKHDLLLYSYCPKPIPSIYSNFSSVSFPYLHYFSNISHKRFWYDVFKKRSIASLNNVHLFRGWKCIMLSVIVLFYLQN